jgi:AraC-like DNA-binding protein
VRRRSTLHTSGLLQVEDCYIPPEGPFPDPYEHRVQIALTYFGIFAYTAGSRSWTIDANKTLFISRGWEAAEDHPLPWLGHAAVLLNPSPELLDEIGAGGSSAFARGTLPASMRLRLLTQQILRRAAPADPLGLDEWSVEAIRESLRAPHRSKGKSSRVVDRAKELLHARTGERLGLDEIARCVGVTPVYLTQEFTRAEGIPLYRYQLRLRLTRALIELHHCDDITGLALDLGFSSHSHFTAAFRSAFGITPNFYRSTIGTRRLPFVEGFARHRNLDRGLLLTALFHSRSALRGSAPPACR